MYSAVQLQTPEASSYLAGSPLSESCLSQGATIIRLATDRSITARNCMHKALAHPGRALAADTHAHKALAHPGRALAADTHAHKALAHPGRALAAGMSITTRNK